jgi:hypothetical protein
MKSHKLIKLEFSNLQKIMLTGISIIVFCQFVRGQSTWSHTNNLYFNYLQLKDQMNYGLIFKGAGINYSYSLFCQNDRRLVSYEGKIGLSVIQSHDIPAFNMNITPFHLNYLLKSKNNKYNAFGFFLISEYNNLFNPDLHSGILFWHTHLGLGPVVKYSQKIRGSQFKISVNFSLIGLNSRQPMYHDPYFWNIGYIDLIKPRFSDLSFGSLNKYNYSEFEFIWEPSSDSRAVFAYNLKYIGYYAEPTLTLLNQSVKLIFKPKPK